MSLKVQPRMFEESTNSGYVQQHFGMWRSEIRAELQLSSDGKLRMIYLHTPDAYRIDKHEWDYIEIKDYISETRKLDIEDNKIENDYLWVIEWCQE